MGVESVKHDVKTLFLIMNTVIALAGGLFPAALGVSLLVTIRYVPGSTPAYLAAGAAVLGVTALGSYGAVVERRALLTVYLMLTGLATVLEMAATVIYRQFFATEFFIFFIFCPCIQLTTMALAVILSKLLHKESSARPAPSAPVAAHAAHAALYTPGAVPV